jgi:hypothetical protein
MFSIFLLTTAKVKAETCSDILYIGSWNIQWLGNAKEGKRQPQSPDDIASYINTSKVDVLALAEISVSRDSSGKFRNEQLEKAFSTLNNQNQSWQYILFEKRPGARAPQDQWTGLAWNTKKIQLAKDPVKLEIEINLEKEKQIASRLTPPPVADQAIWNRLPYAVKLTAGKNKTDFLVIPIHMKSNIGGKETAKAREYEAELLVSSLDKLKDEIPESDVVIMGDSNMLSTNEAAAKIFLKKGFIDCNGHDLSTHISFGTQKTAPFDRIFVLPNQPETQGTCLTSGNGSGYMDFKIFKEKDWRPKLTPSDFRKLLSDHYLIRTALCIGKDDD